MLQICCGSSSARLFVYVPHKTLYTKFLVVWEREKIGKQRFFGLNFGIFRLRFYRKYFFRALVWRHRHIDDKNVLHSITKQGTKWKHGWQIKMERKSEMKCLLTHLVLFCFIYSLFTEIIILYWYFFNPWQFVFFIIRLFSLTQCPGVHSWTVSLLRIQIYSEHLKPFTLDMRNNIVSPLNTRIGHLCLPNRKARHHHFSRFY